MGGHCPLPYPPHGVDKSILDARRDLASDGREGGMVLCTQCHTKVSSRWCPTRVSRKSVLQTESVTTRHHIVLDNVHKVAQQDSSG